MEVLKREYSDATTYRKIMEFIKENGVGVLDDFWREVEKAKENFSLDDEYIYGVNVFDQIKDRYPAVIEFLKQFNGHFLYDTKFEDRDFLTFLMYFTVPTRDGKPKNIDNCIDVAKRLEELNIYRMQDFCYSRLGSKLWSNCGEIILKPDKSGEFILIKKTYFDNSNILISEGRVWGNYYINGIKRDPDVISYGMYLDCKAFETAYKSRFIISAELTPCGKQMRTAEIFDFDFDVNKLPTEEELLSNTIPKYDFAYDSREYNYCPRPKNLEYVKKFQIGKR